MSAPNSSLPARPKSPITFYHSATSRMHGLLSPPSSGRVRDRCDDFEMLSQCAEQAPYVTVPSQYSRPTWSGAPGDSRIEEGDRRSRVAISSRRPASLTPPTSGRTDRDDCSSTDSDITLGAATEGERSVARPSILRPTIASDDEHTSSSTSRLDRRPHSRLARGPVRDSPHNPFLAGGPADLGRTGQAPVCTRAPVIKEKGRITYVFRGTRLVFADPDDDMDSDSSQSPTSSPRLRPRLLFPKAHAADLARSRVLRCEERRTDGQQLGRSKRKASSTERDDAPPAQRPRRGLFTDQIYALEDAKRHDSSHRSRQSSHGDVFTSIASSSTYDGYGCRDAERRALLARMDNAGWDSDTDDHDDTCEPRLPRAVEGASGVHSQHQQRPVTLQPQRGHAHSLAHQMHVPTHLRRH